MPERIYNFSPGPATLPLSVLNEAASDIVNFNDKGIGLIELSHRSKEFMAVADETESLIRELLDVPGNYKVLFLQGGASSQFFMIPMNLLGAGKKATYLNTGVWSKKAIKEAENFGDITVAYSSADVSFNRVPEDSEYSVAPDSEIYIWFQIILFTERNFQNFQKKRQCLFATCPQTFCPGLWIYQNSGLFLPVLKKIWVQPV